VGTERTSSTGLEKRKWLAPASRCWYRPCHCRVPPGVLSFCPRLRH